MIHKLLKKKNAHKVFLYWCIRIVLVLMKTKRFHVQESGHQI